jgi:hypothetical protein
MKWGVVRRGNAAELGARLDHEGLPAGQELCAARARSSPAQSHRV